MGPSQCPPSPGPTQDTGCPFRQRHCLLKGCERLFQPKHYQDRYCGAACRQQAERWRRWHSARKYRASAEGKHCRREQSRRYRERCRQWRAVRWEELLREIDARVVREDNEAAAQLTVAEPREGQRAAPDLEDFPRRPCRRPGCYVLIPILPSVPQQQFCSCRCRQALRRVLDRESRWRRRHGQHPCPRRISRPPPL
jgi:hypothetical protein